MEDLDLVTCLRGEGTQQEQQNCKLRSKANDQLSTNWRIYTQREGSIRKQLNG